MQCSINLSEVDKNVMGEYIDDFVGLDDIFVFSSCEHKHKHHLRLIFQKRREHKLQAKLNKCEFDKPHVKYLGYMVGSGEVHVDWDKVAAVANWEALKDIKEVQ